MEASLKKYYEELVNEVQGRSCNCSMPIPGEGFGKFEPSIYPYFGCMLVGQEPIIIYEPQASRLRQWWQIFTLRAE